MTGCIFLILLLSFPRIVLIVMYMTDYLAVYEATIWLVLGFLFMPCTTIGYAVSMNEIGSVSSWGILLIFVCILIDMMSDASSTK